MQEPVAELRVVSVEIDELVEEVGVVSLRIRVGLFAPLVERLRGEAEHPTRCRHAHALSGEIDNERVHHFGSISFAKNAAALRKIRFSSSRILLRFFNSRVSAASALVTPGRSPLSSSGRQSKTRQPQVSELGLFVELRRIELLTSSLP